MLFRRSSNRLAILRNVAAGMEVANDIGASGSIYNLYNKIVQQKWETPRSVDIVAAGAKAVSRRSVGCGDIRQTVSIPLVELLRQGNVQHFVERCRRSAASHHQWRGSVQSALQAVVQPHQGIEFQGARKYSRWCYR